MLSGSLCFTSGRVARGEPCDCMATFTSVALHRLTVPCCGVGGVGLNPVEMGLCPERVFLHRTACLCANQWGLAVKSTVCSLINLFSTGFCFIYLFIYLFGGGGMW